MEKVSKIKFFDDLQVIVFKPDFIDGKTNGKFLFFKEEVSIKYLEVIKYSLDIKQRLLFISTEKNSYHIKIKNGSDKLEKCMLYAFQQKDRNEYEKTIRPLFNKLSEKIEKIEKKYNYDKMLIEENEEDIKTYFEKANIEQNGYSDSTLPFRINLDDLTLLQTSLLNNIYIRIVNENITKIIKSMTNYIKLFNFKLLSKLFSLDSFIILEEEDRNKLVEKLKLYANEYLSYKDKLIEFLNLNYDKNIDTKKVREHFENNSVTYYAILEELVGDKYFGSGKHGNQSKEFADIINKVGIDLTEIKLPPRNFQIFGAKFALKQKRILLGDDMGSGKTFQAIMVINHLMKNNKSHFIVIAPASVQKNWENEIKKFSNIDVLQLHGASRLSNVNKWKKDGGIGITTFQTAPRLNLDNVMIDCLVVDEAHYIKNPGAKRSKFAYALSKKSEYVIYMTGTPIEKNIDEMKNLISSLDVKIGNKIEDMYSINKFKQAISNIYLRRNTEDVISELPELVKNDEWLDFSDEESRLYKYYLSLDTPILQLKHKLNDISWSVKNINNSTKLKRLIELVDEIIDNNHKVIVFSNYKKPLALISNYYQDKASDIIDGSVSSSSRISIIDRFNASKTCSILLAQVQAGGVGLNIQSANYVIFCEPQWNPSTENQAIARSRRQGQLKTVFSHKLLNTNSIDVFVMNKLSIKQKIFDDYARDSIAANNISAKDTNENALFKEFIKSERERLGIVVNENRNDNGNVITNN